ncbi:MAG: type III pantothenate kinase [Pseudomonadales bacterium]|jgi:pantothenate kinase type III|nr:type III pantothenate kinase [Pseudomonadales bacterium]
MSDFDVAEKLLAIEVSDAEIKLAVIEKETGRIFQAYKYKPQVKSLTRLLIALDKHPAKRLAYCSVVPTVDSWLMLALFDRYKIWRPIQQRIFTYNLKSSAKISEDLIALTLGAINWQTKNKQPMSTTIVVRMDMATTISVIDQKQVYQGTVIFPGSEFSLSTLNKEVELLKVPVLSKFNNENDLLLGKDMAQAVSIGINVGQINTIRAIVDNLQNKFKTDQVLLTGLSAAAFKNEFSEYDYAPDLIFRGLWYGSSF